MSALPAVMTASGLSYGIPRGPLLCEAISFELLRGQVLLVTGPNGSGKSTLLRLILGQIPTRSGKLEVSVAPRRIGILPQLQNTAFHLPLTLGDIMRISHKGKLDLNEVFSLGLLEPKHLGLPWNTASGGERKRTLLTRVLLQKPELLLLDEPLNHLDNASHERVKKALVGYLSGSAGRLRSLVVVSHQNWPESEKLFSGVVRLHITGPVESELREP